MRRAATARYVQGQDADNEGEPRPSMKKIMSITLALRVGPQGWRTSVEVESGHAMAIDDLRVLAVEALDALKRAVTVERETGALLEVRVEGGNVAEDAEHDLGDEDVGRRSGKSGSDLAARNPAASPTRSRRSRCASIDHISGGAAAIASMTGTSCLTLRWSRSVEPRNIPQLAR